MGRKTKDQLQTELDIAEARVGLLEEQVKSYSSEVKHWKVKAELSDVYAQLPLEDDEIPGMDEGEFPWFPAKGDHFVFVRKADYLAVHRLVEAARDWTPEKLAKQAVLDLKNSDVPLTKRQRVQLAHLEAAAGE